MLDEIFIGFDFGYKRIGVAVGQRCTGSASPLPPLPAVSGIPHWRSVDQIMHAWTPHGLIVGLPTCIDGREQYTTKQARAFAQQLQERFALPTYMVDERLSTVEARSYLFEQGGYRKIKKTAVDSIAACIILEQWLQSSTQDS